VGDVAEAEVRDGEAERCAYEEGFASYAVAQESGGKCYETGSQCKDAGELANKVFSKSQADEVEVVEQYKKSHSCEGGNGKEIKALDIGIVFAEVKTCKPIFEHKVE